jgi:phosphotriesterase-related protein
LTDARDARIGGDPDDVIGPDQVAADEQTLDLLDLHAAALALRRWRPERAGRVMQETILAVDRPLLSSGSMTEGRIQTVTGAIEPGALGRTSIHEHLMLELDRVAFQPVDTAEGRALAEEPVSLATRWWVRQRWTSVRDNLRLTDETMAVAEVARFAAVGGGTIADPTTEGIGRDPAALVRISLATGVRIVMGAGYYVHASHPAWIEAAPEVAIVERIVGDLTEGVGPDKIRAGFIGEVGCSWPLTPRERRVLRAAGVAQRETGVPLMVHPGRNRAAPSEIVDELEDVGADLERTAICHLERTFGRPEEFVELGRRGVWPRATSVGTTLRSRWS